MGSHSLRRLYCYHFPAGSFECVDECAGYFVSREAVVPMRVDAIEDPIGALLERRVELRIVSDLRWLREAVVASTLRFSVIRMPGPGPTPSSGNWSR